MANLICELEGVLGRKLKLYDTKIVITTKETVGSLLTGNFSDGEKTIYLCDVVGVQFKKSNSLVGYLQFETPSLQMNNKNDNMFSENTFTYEKGKNGITNELMEVLYNFVCDRIEELKYNVKIIEDIDAVRNKFSRISKVKTEPTSQPSIQRNKVTVKKEEFKNTLCCPECKENLAFMGWDDSDLENSQVCPFCESEILFD